MKNFHSKEHFRVMSNRNQLIYLHKETQREREKTVILQMLETYIYITEMRIRLESTISLSLNRTAVTVSHRFLKRANTLAACAYDIQKTSFISIITVDTFIKPNE